MNFIQKRILSFFCQKFVFSRRVNMKKRYGILKALLLIACCLVLCLGFVACDKGAQGPAGEKGEDGAPGVSIVSVEKTQTQALTDTYTITYSNGTTSTFTVTNGAKGEDGEDGENGVSVTGVSVNEEGELIISFSKGEPVNVGKVTGENGKDGADANTDDLAFVVFATGVEGENFNPVLLKKGETLGELPTPTKESYQFEGWYYEDTLVTAETAIEHSMTLTAKWSPRVTVIMTDSNVYEPDREVEFAFYWQYPEKLSSTPTFVGITRTYEEDTQTYTIEEAIEAGFITEFCAPLAEYTPNLNAYVGFLTFKAAGDYVVSFQMGEGSITSMNVRVLAYVDEEDGEVPFINNIFENEMFILQLDSMCDVLEYFGETALQDYPVLTTMYEVLKDKNFYAMTYFELEALYSELVAGMNEGAPKDYEERYDGDSWAIQQMEVLLKTWCAEQYGEGEEGEAQFKQALIQRLRDESPLDPDFIYKENWEEEFAEAELFDVFMTISNSLCGGGMYFIEEFFMYEILDGAFAEDGILTSGFPFLKEMCIDVITARQAWLDGIGTEREELLRGEYISLAAELFSLCFYLEG